MASTLLAFEEELPCWSASTHGHFHHTNSDPPVECSLELKELPVSSDTAIAAVIAFVSEDMGEHFLLVEMLPADFGECIPGVLAVGSAVCRQV